MVDIIKELEIDIIKITLKNIDVKLSNLGAGIIDIKYIDKDNIKESVVAQPLNASEYINNEAYYGKVCGRYSGRLDKAKLKLNDKIYDLEKNWNNTSSLHGGTNGISEKIWDYTIRENEESVQVIFNTISLNNESGFPGNLSIKTTYTISNDKIEIDYNATTDQDTVCNLTNHTYFNLSGNCKTKILQQELYINSSNYTNLNHELITISIDEVNDTFDFRKPKLIKENIYDDKLQKHPTLGYDHCFLFDDINIKKCNAFLYDNKSKRKLEVYTTYPCMVVYSTCYPSKHVISNNKPIEQYSAICLETQYLPNGVNMGLNDKSILRVNEIYCEKTIYKFSII